VDTRKFCTKIIGTCWTKNASRVVSTGNAGNAGTTAPQDAPEDEDEVLTQVIARVGAEPSTPNATVQVKRKRGRPPKNNKRLRI